MGEHFAVSSMCVSSWIQILTMQNKTKHKIIVYLAKVVPFKEWHQALECKADFTETLHQD